MGLLIKQFLCFHPNHDNLHHKRYLPQKGGYKNEFQEMWFTFQQKKYSFLIQKEYDDENEHIENLYIVFSDHTKACVSILIDKQKQEAVIQNVQSNVKCILHPKTDQGIGTILMNFTLSLLKHNKHKLGIHRLEVMDMATVPCMDKLYPNVRLFDLYVLTRGISWYESFGFEIYSRNQTNIIKLQQISKQNQTIMKTVKKKDLSMIDIIDSAFHKAVQKIDKDYLKTNFRLIFKIWNRYDENALVKDIFKAISLADCNLFRILHSIIMNQLGIQSIYGESYELFL